MLFGEKSVFVRRIVRNTQTLAKYIIYEPFEEHVLNCLCPPPPQCLSAKTVDIITLFRQRSRCLVILHHLRPALKRRKCTKNDTRVFPLLLRKHILYVQISLFIAVKQSESKLFFVIHCGPTRTSLGVRFRILGIVNNRI